MGKIRLMITFVGARFYLTLIIEWIILKQIFCSEIQRKQDRNFGLIHGMAPKKTGCSTVCEIGVGL